MGPLAMLFAAAFLVAVAVMPIFIRLARRFGLVDHPDGNRKLQRDAVPLCGGIAVACATAIVLSVAVVVDESWRVAVVSRFSLLVGIACGGTILLVAGIVDDAVNLRGRHKLMAQFAAIAALLGCGFLVDSVTLFGETWPLGIFGAGVTACWFLGTINSFNLVDGVDGLAGTLGFVCSAAIAAIAVHLGHPCEAAVAITIAGALLGFLVFNRPPARVYLGDAGSMFLGLVLGALALRVTAKGPTAVLLASAVALWSLPFFDTTAALVRRRLSGRSLFTTDRSHVHHVLAQRGWGARRISLVLGALAATCAVGAFASVVLKSEWIAVATVTGIASILILSGLFGRSETMMVLRAIRRRTKVFNRSQSGEIGVRPSTSDVSHLHGDADWLDVWNEIVTLADRFQLHSVRLNLSIPSVGEEFHASWRNSDQFEEETSWFVRLPLSSSGRRVGRVEIAGDGSIEGSLQPSEVADLTQSIQPMIDDHMERLLKVDESRALSTNVT